MQCVDTISNSRPVKQISSECEEEMQQPRLCKLGIFRQGREEALVKYLVSSAAQLAFAFAEQPFAHLARGLHQLLALVANLVARVSKGTGGCL